ncbi:DUF4150 domain-containing protein [Polyangium jinanense]|uniref:DUF4150 domain-containing protein n=1 Tax=Polyangium jinanense TaxID=2829994 RepID=A0A9X3X0T9_9BACT|nr:DUF4150 domain-containing protein [Polyangium jinanense]MDC3952520.1 DUF4150 domain-containing protein [Polyangium jinanense]MDC3980148.1 DUF4150 domain-containing protein [Polyangium jinanense]
MFANSQMMGMSLGFPDVCLTPTPAPVPIPYPNISAQPMGVPAAYNILFMGTPAHNMATSVPLTNGDNPGVALGVASGIVMGPSRHLTAAFRVLAGGIPATRMTSMTLTNSTNCPGVSIVPSQVKVLLLGP